MIGDSCCRNLFVELVYIVDRLFTKYSDAKAAVCLTALSENVLRYVDRIKKEVKARVTEEMKEFFSKIWNDGNYESDVP